MTWFILTLSQLCNTLVRGPESVGDCCHFARCDIQSSDTSGKMGTGPLSQALSAQTLIRKTQMETTAPITEDELLKRITVDQAIFNGKPIVRGLRIAVKHVLAMLVAGDTPEKLLAEYPFLEPADIQACIAYAHRSLAGEQVYERIAKAKAS